MAVSTEIPFVELAAKTNYSFLEGAAHPEEMVAQAKALGYAGLGVVDTLGVYGSPRAHVAAKEHGLPLIVGSELCVDGARVLLLAKNRKGYGNLCELLTLAHQDRDNPAASLGAVCTFAPDLFCLLPSWKFPDDKIGLLKDTFGSDLAFVASQFLDGSDTARLLQADKLSRKWEIPCIASNEPLFPSPDRKHLQDVLTCIRHNCTLRTAGLHLLPNAERFLKPVSQIHSLFKNLPQWIERTARIANDCHFSLDEIHYRYPTEWIPAGHTGNSYLEELVWKGAKDRYPSGTSKKVEDLLLHELALIRELEYSDYFLTIWDIVVFARSQGILCQGRGSAANSLVCYVLGITSIDPAQLDLLFERFISRERREPPDIDIDFEHERREEVIQYIYRRYGRHRAAITAEVICFRKKSALREVAKVFEIPMATVEQLGTVTHRRKIAEIPADELLATAPDIPVPHVQKYFEIVQAIRSFPRHLGTHVGGFVLCQDALTRNVPIEKAAMVDRTIVQWDKNDLDALGFVRVDILGLGILTAIRKTFDYINETRGTRYTLANLPKEDPRVYDRICEADTVGVFQIESRAQMNMLPRLKPRCFYDLVVEVSIVRPGPIQGDMVHPYLKRRMGEEPVDYAHPLLESILKKTYGVPLFQEQIMKMAMAVADFSAGKADELRRAMGSWRRDGGNRLTRLGDAFKEGLVRKGISQEYADRIFHQIEGFAEYGFPESHAASFSVLVYATAYLKLYYPDAFLVGLLNAQPMGFYSAHSLIHDGMRHGVHVHGIDVQLSHWDSRLPEVMHVRLGFREIRGLKEGVGRAIEKARGETCFASFEDFIERVSSALKPIPLTKRDCFLIAGAHGFESLGLDRRRAFWKIQALHLQDSLAFTPAEAAQSLPLETRWEKISGDYDSQGVCLNEHPMAYFRPWLTRQRYVTSKDIIHQREGAQVWAAGISICRQQPPTASGVLFITLEDEFGFINLVVWKTAFEPYREVLLTQSFLTVRGRIQKAPGAKVLHLIVDHAEPLLHEEDAPPMPAHDFH